MSVVKHIFNGTPIVALLLCLVIINSKAFGQCTIPINTFANTAQTNATTVLGADVVNPGNAVNGNLSTYSTLEGGLLGTATIFLKFASQVPAGTAVTVKLGLPSSLVSLLSKVEIQPFTNLHNSFGWTADDVGAAVTDGSLLGLLNGAGDQEFTFTPKTSGGVNVAYDGVWVKIGGISVAQSLNVYGAYTTATGSTSNPAVACGSPVDVLSGVRAGTVLGGIANATGTVTSPLNAIDNDPTYSTYSEMFVGAQVLSQVYHTTIFNSLSQTGDKVRLILQKPGGGILDLNAITNFTIQLYNGNTAVGTAISSSSGLLSVSLLPGTAGNEKYQVDLIPPSPLVFDRVDIQVGGLAGVGLVPGLRIYDVKRIIATPTTNIDGAAAVTKTVCEGSTATFVVNNSQTCTTYKWYDAATGGTLLATGTSYSPPLASLSTTVSNQYYVEATRDGCTETSTRTPVTLIVNPAPAITPNLSPKTCAGTTTSPMTYIGATNTPTLYSITWSAAATTAGFVAVTDAALPAGQITIAVPATAPAGPYNGTLYVKNANGCQSTGKAFVLNLDARASQPIIVLTP